MTTATARRETAKFYVSERLGIETSEELRKLLQEPFQPDAAEVEYDPDLAEIAGTPLAETLRIDEALLGSMLTAHANIRRKVAAQSNDSEGLNEAYGNLWSNLYEEKLRLPTTRGFFDSLASCQGGDEVTLLSKHPKVGIDGKMGLREYRARSAPYVAAFGVELHPGDLDAGLVHASVKDRITA